MNCYVHPTTSAVASCVNCGKGVCAACTRQVAGKVYCWDCEATGVPFRGQGSSQPRPAQVVQLAQPAEPARAERSRSVGLVVVSVIVLCLLVALTAIIVIAVLVLIGGNINTPQPARASVPAALASARGTG
jgi:hypothetical protein